MRVLFGWEGIRHEEIYLFFIGDIEHGAPVFVRRIKYNTGGT